MTDFYAPAYLPENISSRELLAQVVFDRLYFLNASIDDLERLLHRRDELRRESLREIDDNICEIRTAIYDLEALANTDHSAKTSLERQIIDLYKEKRNHELSNWRDTAEIKRELRGVQRELKTVLVDLWLAGLMFSPN